MRESGGLRRSRQRMITPDKRWTLPRYYRIWASMSTAGDIWPALSPVRGEGRPRGGKGACPEGAAKVRVGRGRPRGGAGGGGQGAGREGAAKMGGQRGRPGGPAGGSGAARRPGAPNRQAGE